VCRHYRVPPARTTVAPCGADDVFGPPADAARARAVAARLGARPPYLLHVGGAAPYKNVGALIAAFARVARRPGFAAVSLAMAGPDDGRGSLAAAIAADARAHGVGERVVWLGFRGDAELATLYQAAEALVLPSLTEGFGLPAVEAVACGTPAVVTRASPLPALLGGAALVVDPLSIDDIAGALTTVLGDHAVRAGLRAAAVERAGTLSWTQTAAALETALRDAVAMRGGGR
jgi:glycosyltransferase involved in cell wall biosynthesis